MKVEEKQRGSAAGAETQGTDLWSGNWISEKHVLIKPLLPRCLCKINNHNNNNNNLYCLLYKINLLIKSVQGSY